MKENQQEEIRTGVYADYRSRLNEEYGQTFDKVEEWCLTQTLSSAELNESLGYLMDVFLEAQTNGVPVRKITGSDIGSFCRGFLSDVSPLSRVRGVLEYGRSVAWIFLVIDAFMLLPSLGEGKGLWAALCEESAQFYGTVIGLVFGSLLTVISNAVVRQMVCRMKKYRKMYHAIVYVIVNAVGIGALWLVPDFELDVPGIPFGISPLVCVVWLAVTRLVMGFMNVAAGKRFFAKEEKRGTGQRSFRAMVLHDMVEENRKMYEKTNRKREKKGKPALTQAEFLEKYRSDTQKGKSYLWISLVLVGAVYLGFIVQVALTSEPLDTFLFILLLVVVYMLFMYPFLVYPTKVRAQFQQLMDESGKSFFDEEFYDILNEKVK